MGVYDSIWVPCPNCQAPYEAQTKSGPCRMEQFSLADAPADVLKDVNRHAPFTCDCGCEFKVEGRVSVRTKRANRPEPDVSVSGLTLAEAMYAFKNAVEAKGWLSIGLRVEIMNIVADDPPYPTIRVEIWAWVV